MNHTPYTYTYIYALQDPITLEVRYVGKADNPWDRLNRHMRDKSDTYKTRWLSKLKIINSKPLLNIVAKVNIEDWSDAEIYWISYFRSLGCPLTNIQGGGEGFTTTPREYLQRHTGVKVKIIRTKKASVVKQHKKRKSHTIPNRNNTIYRTQEFRDKISRVRSKEYLITDPAGNTFDVTNMKLFCQDHGLKPSNMVKVLKGKMIQHKGYKAKYK